MVGAALPTLAALFATTDQIVVSVPAMAMGFLAASGALGAWLGGAPVVKSALKGVVSGAFAMAVTATIGDLVGRAIWSAMFDPWRADVGETRQ